MQDMLNIYEAAETLRLQPATMRVWRHRGQGPRGFKVGGRLMYRREEIERYLANQMATTTIGGEY